MAKRPFNSTAEMRKELVTWEGAWGNQLPTRMLLYACERLDEIAQLLKSKRARRRNPSPYNRFVSQGMKAGKSLKQISEEWKSRQQQTVIG